MLPITYVRENAEQVRTALRNRGHSLEQLEKAGVKLTSLTAEGRAKFKELSLPAYTAILSADQVKAFVDAANKNR